MQIIKHLAGEVGTGGGRSYWLWVAELGEMTARWKRSTWWHEAVCMVMGGGRGAVAPIGGNSKSGGGGRREGMNQRYVSAKRGPRAIFLVKSDVARGAGAPSRLLALWDRRGSAGYFIWLQYAPVSYRVHCYEPKIASASQ
jgi:hypothetical protein